MGGRPARPVEERFWEKTERQPDGCLVWTAVRGDHGYGRFRGPDGRTHLAHRFAYVLVHGPIPSGMVVRHSCDNRGCVEPSHLSVGSYSDNTQDASARGLLWQTRVTHCPKGHPYSGENLRLNTRETAPSAAERVSPVRRSGTQRITRKVRRWGQQHASNSGRAVLGLHRTTTQRVSPLDRDVATRVWGDSRGRSHRAGAPFCVAACSRRYPRRSGAASRV